MGRPPTVKKVIVTCAHCGNTKAIFPSHAVYNEYFCDNKCRHEHRHQERKCKCGAERTTETCYIRPGGTLDDKCKKCRIKFNNRNRKPKKPAIPTEKKKRQKICGNDNQRMGSQKGNWIKRMTENPYMFTSTFQKAATEKNIKAQANQLF